MKIKIELTESQYFLLLDANNEAHLALDDIDNSDYSQSKNLKMLDRIAQKLINAHEAAQ